MTTSELALKMKGYEAAYQTYLPNKLPIIIRVDGRAFSRLTRRLFNRSFSMVFNRIMCSTALELMLGIPGAVFAYQQSDEISLLLINYKKEETQPWFNNRLDKMVSNTSAIASVTFNNLMLEQFGEGWTPKGYEIFDARAFIVPPHDVLEYFKWRQTDCRRNAVLSLARETMSHAEVQGKAPKLLIKELLEEKNIDFYSEPIERILGNSFSLEPVPLDDGRFRNKPTYIGAELFDEKPELITKHVYSGLLE